MPLYEYKRKKSGDTFTVRQKISDPPLQICPDTGEEVSRVIGAARVKFKGSGFYQTDYGGKNPSSG